MPSRFIQMYRQHFDRLRSTLNRNVYCTQYKNNGRFRIRNNYYIMKHQISVSWNSHWHSKYQAFIYNFILYPKQHFLVRFSPKYHRFFRDCNRSSIQTISIVNDFPKLVYHIDFSSTNESFAPTEIPGGNHKKERMPKRTISQGIHKTRN